MQAEQEEHSLEKKNTKPLADVPVKCIFFLKRIMILVFDGRYTLELEKTIDPFAVKSCSFAKTKIFPWKYSSFRLCYKYSGR